MEETLAPRLAELVSALSLAADLASGLALETAPRTSVLAVEFGRVLGAVPAGRAPPMQASPGPPVA